MFRYFALDRIILEALSYVMNKFHLSLDVQQWEGVTFRKAFVFRIRQSVNMERRRLDN